MSLSIKNKKAFTLAETLIALLVVSLTSLLIFSSARMVGKTSAYQDKSRVTDWIRFNAFMEQELSSGRLVSASPQQLVLKKGENLIYYEQYKNLIRKSGQSGGHEPLLAKVRSLTFEVIGDYCYCWVQLENGDTYKGVFIIVAEEKR